MEVTLAPLLGWRSGKPAPFQPFVAANCASTASSLSTSYLASLRALVPFRGHSSQPSDALVPSPGVISKSGIKSPPPFTAVWKSVFLSNCNSFSRNGVFFSLWF